MTYSPFKVLCFILLPVSLIYGQLEGDKYVLGYYGLGNQEYSIMYLDFSGPEVEIEWHFDEDMLILETSSNICDTNGNVLFWTNGMQIFGDGQKRIADTIAYFDDMSGYWDYYYSNTYGPFGFPEHDGAIILPVPDHQNEYLTLYHACEQHPTNFYQITRYLSARVSLNPQSGDYTLLYKDSLVGPQHMWYTGTLNATRHANGKDWWVVAFEEDSPRYFVYLLDHSGISLHHEGEVDEPVLEGLGDAAFSSQGNYLARMDAISLPVGQFITVYSFDRCIGELTRLTTLHQEAGVFTGASFSPNERFLYGDNNKHLWQWDLWAPDIEGSKLLIDTFDGFQQPGWGDMQFGPMFEAPDGRIYIVPPAGSSEFIHVIEHPNLEGKACKFKQHSINLTKPNGRSSPNLPNYRLGPIDGSICDTLNLNNIPVSRWRYQEELAENPQVIQFTDLSYNNPSFWDWDFGDGNTSNLNDPTHQFSLGVYKVCLTIGNEYGVDSSCQFINILNVGIEDNIENRYDLSISPNPFQNFIRIASSSKEYRNITLELYNTNGQRVFFRSSLLIPSTIYFPDLAPGVYYCVIREKDSAERVFTIVKS